MVGPRNPKDLPKARSSGATRRAAVGLILGAPLLGACAGVQQSLSQFSNPFSSQAGPSGQPHPPLVCRTRLVEYAASTGKRSFAALLPENAYGNVVEAAFKQAVGRRGGRIVAFEKYGADRAAAARTVAQALGQADALFIADDGDSVVSMADALTAAGANLKNIQLLGTGLWDNPRVYASPALQGGLYAAPDPAGFRSFSNRYRAKYGGASAATATLAYDAVALVAALARTQGPQRFSPEVLTSPSGFAGIDGLF